MALVYDLQGEAAVEMLLRHRFVRRVEEHYEFADSQLGGGVRIQLCDDDGKPVFPRIQRLSIEPATLTAEQDAERATSIYGQRQTVMASLRKLAWGIEAMSVLSITDRRSFVGIEYHAENYFLRVSTVHEQLLRLIGLILKLPDAETLSRRRLQEHIDRLSLELSGPLAQLASHLTHVRRRRNEVAHGLEFEDERLGAARSWITANLDANYNGERPEEVSVLAEWRDELVVEMSSGIRTLVVDIACLFDELLPIAIRTMPGWRETENAT